MVKRGFSLVEMALVLVTVALLVAGISAGHTLVEQSKLKTVMTQANEVNTALQSFHAKYNYLPGDIPEATVFWSGTNNGNGNGAITLLEHSSGTNFTEVGRVFEHLRLSGIYPGTFVGGAKIADSALPNQGIVPETIRNGAIIVTNYTPGGGYSFVNRNILGGNSVNVIRVGGTTNTFSHYQSQVGNGLFTIEEVMLFDKKFDDGLARSGKITGHNELLDFSGGTGEECLRFINGTTHDPALFAGGAEYNNGSSEMCNISFDTAF